VITKFAIVSVLFIGFFYPSQAFGETFLTTIEGNYQLHKAANVPSHSHEQDCPKNVKVEVRAEMGELSLRNRSNNKLIEKFRSINKTEEVEKVDAATWLEIKTTLKRSILTKRSRYCPGGFKKNCQGQKLRPEISLVKTDDDLVVNVYNQDHQLHSKCFYQRPNEIGF